MEVVYEIHIIQQVQFSLWIFFFFFFLALNQSETLVALPLTFKLCKLKLWIKNTANGNNLAYIAKQF